MDYRKLISFGKGGYVISIPKDWVVENKLEKGSFIIIKNDGNVLSLMPKDDLESTKSSISEILIDVENKSINKIKREIISAYLKSYNQIIIRGVNLKTKLPEIGGVVRNLIALEIIESSKEKLVLKDFLDFDALNVPQLFRKMDNILRTMFHDILAGDYGDIQNRNSDANRYFFLILKAVKKVTDDTTTLKKLKLSLSELFVYWNNAMIIESMSDSINRIAKILALKQIKAPTFKELLAVISDLDEIFTKSITSFYKNDAELAYSYSNKKIEISHLCSKLYEQHWQEKDVPIVLETLKYLARLNHKILRRVYG